MAESRRRNRRSSTDLLAELHLDVGDARICLCSAQPTALSWSQPRVSCAHRGTVLHCGFWGLSCPPMDASCHVLTWKDGMDYQQMFLSMSVHPFVFNPQNTCYSVLGQQTLLRNKPGPARELSLVYWRWWRGEPFPVSCTYLGVSPWRSQYIAFSFSSTTVRSEEQPPSKV